MRSLAYPAPGATRWSPCVLGGGPDCPTCVPPVDQRCPEKRAYAPCLLLGEHDVHRDGFGTSWWLEEQS